MLDSYVIEAFRRDERARPIVERARLELPLHYIPPEEDYSDRGQEDDVDRGVCIIPLRPTLPPEDDTET